MRTPKAVPVLLRHAPTGTEILVFEHPQAGVQLVKGTVEPSESVSEAAMRELREESGVADAVCVGDLGTWESCPQGQVWYFREIRVASSLPDTWEHFTIDGGGHLFKFHWHRLTDEPANNWHPVYVAALDFVRQALGASGSSAARGAA